MLHILFNQSAGIYPLYHTTPTCTTYTRGSAHDSDLCYILFNQSSGNYPLYYTTPTSHPPAFRPMLAKTHQNPKDYLLFTRSKQIQSVEDKA